MNTTAPLADGRPRGGYVCNWCHEGPVVGEITETEGRRTRVHYVCATCHRCQGCDDPGAGPLRRVRVLLGDTKPSATWEPVVYCPVCIDMASVNWNGCTWGVEGAE